MNNEVVKYDNQLNNVQFRKFNNREFNIFFSIISKLKNKGSSRVTLTFEKIKKLSDYKQHGSKFINDLDNLYTKMLNLKIWRSDKKASEKWVLFIYYKIDKENNTVTVSVNPDLINVVNNWATWTRFSLRQFVDLKSTYSKTTFRLLKQYRTVGKRTFSINEFKSLLDIPSSYKSNDINKRVITPIKEELIPLFRGLAIRKKYGRGRGKPVIGYSFTWKSEQKNADDFSKGLEKDKQEKEYNVIHNSELSSKEKEKLIKKITGSKIKTTVEKIEPKQKEQEKNKYIFDDPEFKKDFDEYINF